MATFTLPAQVRSGDLFSPSITWPAGMNQANLQVLLPVDSERADPTKRLDLAIEFSKDNGATWKAYVMAGWIGGSGVVGKDGTLNPAPNVGTSGPGGNALVRLHVIIPSPLTVGATITTS